MRRFLSQDRAMKKLDEVLLGQKTPVGCVVGIYYLPYYPIEYRVHFNGHNICIVGKDEETGVYSVLDPVTIEKVTLTTKDLKKVRFHLSPDGTDVLDQKDARGDTRSEAVGPESHQEEL